MPYVNTDAIQIFLDRVAATIGDDAHVVMVLDRAGWHGSKALAVPATITLVPLPPYSPELNPVERVWLYLKERFLSHRLLADYDAIVTAASTAWNRLTALPGPPASQSLELWIAGIIPMARSTVPRQTYPRWEQGRVSSARRDLCGGRWATHVPTAIEGQLTTGCRPR
jgi:transposase